MNPQTVPEWQTYISSLSGEDLRSKVIAANSLEFVRILQEDALSPAEITKVFLMWARQCELDNQAIPEGFAGEYVSLYELLEQSRAGLLEGRVAAAPVEKTSDWGSSFRSLLETEDQTKARLFGRELHLTEEFMDNLASLRREQVVRELVELHHRLEEGGSPEPVLRKALVGIVLKKVQALAKHYLSLFSSEARAQMGSHNGPPGVIQDLLTKVERLAPLVSTGKVGIPLFLKLLGGSEHSFRD